MITIMMMMMTMTPVFLGYPIPKRDMLQSRLVHGQRLGTGEVGTGYIVVNGPSEHGMFKIIYIYIYISNNEY